MDVRAGLALALSLAAASAPAVAAQPRPGTFDLAFPGFPDNVSPVGLAVHPDGRIIHAAIGNRAWVRAYTPDGRLDPSFGTSGGEAALVCPPEAGPDRCAHLGFPAGIAIAPDGDILVGAGTAHASTWGASRLTVWRMSGDGRPDPGFGEGGRIVPLPDDYSPGTDIAVQGDGRIVVAAPRGASADPEPTILLRFLPDGTADRSFGLDGRAFVYSYGYDPELELAPDGSAILSTGTLSSLTRILPDGTTDAAFAANRDRSTQALTRRGIQGREISGLVVLPDGRLRAATGAGTRTDSGFGLLGFLPDGRLDPAFGARGHAVLVHPRKGHYESALTAVADARGGILVGGGRSTDAEFSDNGLAVGRFRPDGRPDRSFGDRGVALVGRAGRSAALAVAPDGGIISADHRFDRSWMYHGTGLVRLHGGYDDARPRIRARRRCARGRAIVRIRIVDLSGLARVTVRAAGRRLRSTERKRFRVRAPRGARRLTVIAEDLAGNTTHHRVRLPACDGPTARPARRG